MVGDILGSFLFLFIGATFSARDQKTIKKFNISCKFPPATCPSHICAISHLCCHCHVTLFFTAVIYRSWAAKQLSIWPEVIFLNFLRLFFPLSFHFLSLSHMCFLSVAFVFSFHGLPTHPFNFLQSPTDSATRTPACSIVIQLPNVSPL